MPVTHASIVVREHRRAAAADPEPATTAVSAGRRLRVEESRGLVRARPADLAPLPTARLA